MIGRCVAAHCKVFVMCFHWNLLYQLLIMHWRLFCFTINCFEIVEFTFDKFHVQLNLYLPNLAVGLQQRNNRFVIIKNSLLTFNIKIPVLSNGKTRASVSSICITARNVGLADRSLVGLPQMQTLWLIGSDLLC